MTSWPIVAVASKWTMGQPASGSKGDVCWRTCRTNGWRSRHLRAKAGSLYFGGGQVRLSSQPVVAIDGPPRFGLAFDPVREGCGRQGVMGQVAHAHGCSRLASRALWFAY